MIRRLPLEAFHFYNLPGFFYACSKDNKPLRFLFTSVLNTEKNMEKLKVIVARLIKSKCNGFWPIDATRNCLLV